MNRRKIILVLAFIGSSLLASAQYLDPSSLEKAPIINFAETIDSAALKVSYRFTFVRDTLKPDIYTQPDVQTLLIGRKTSKYFSQKFIESTYLSDNIGVCSFEIFKNHPEGQMTVTDIGNEFDLGTNFMYKEEMPVIDWTLTTDTSTVFYIPCRKATAFFRGRQYEAWFASSIPIGEGPWKFHGLPGLILKVSDSKLQILFECTGIQQLAKPEAIAIHRLNYQITTRQELNRLYKEFMDDVVGYSKKHLTELMGQVDNVPPLPYNPIELE
ncbi:GLPGLI family protein [Limibacterium fermenti]|uniref:GLPGLI family protein n=1 Tax=Limibacterium fermenti TaxID=3229863 RepID=UPI003A5FC572